MFLGSYLAHLSILKTTGLNSAVLPVSLAADSAIPANPASRKSSRPATRPRWAAMGLLLAATVCCAGISAAQSAPQPNTWTWVGGSSSVNQAGVYGLLGTPDAGNFPPARSEASDWVDGSANFWFFGGDGYNDLWEYSPSTNVWTWMGGNKTFNCGTAGCSEYPGVYGILGTPADGTLPGGRSSATSWTDSNGHLWLFGGIGEDSVGPPDSGYLNDLWEYNPTTNQWAWMSGSSTLTCDWGVGHCAAPAQYVGPPGTIVVGNVPAGRDGAMGWTDSSGNPWLFGGVTTVDVVGVGTVSIFLNDLWQYNPSANQWKWMGGSIPAPCPVGVTCLGPSGVYGKMGTPAPTNIPGGRSGAATWTDSSGNLWLFGGCGVVANTFNYLDDLWEYSPVTNEWAFMLGTSSPVSRGGWAGRYGALGSPGAEFHPGGRCSPASWTDSTGNFWLFGGGGADAFGNLGALNDLWEFNPATIEWTWVAGSAILDCVTDQIGHPTCTQPGLYGLLGQTAAGDTPGGRSAGAAWNDASGNLWLFGGAGDDANGTAGLLGDLWEYQPAGALPPAARPTFSVPSGNYSTTQTVSLANATSGSTIYYTVDGSTPTAASSAYSAALSISQTTTVKAIAVASGYANSALSSATYTIGPIPAATPIIMPPAGTYNAPQTASINDSTAGATIYYTTDGTTPTAASSVYAGSMTVASNETIEAMAVAEGYSDSAVAANAIHLQLATPVLSPSGGTFTTVQTVTITDPTPGAAIYYTADSSYPSAFSALYQGPITVSASEIIRAIAIVPGYTNSDTVSASYTINLPVAATPVITPGGGLYTSPQTVTITDATPGATIYYSNTGSGPISQLYTGPMPVWSGETLDAVAIGNGYASSLVARAGYTINLQVATPTFSVPGGTYTSVQTLSITDSTAGSVIYYTTNGSPPTNLSTLYQGPITVSANESIVAIGMLSGYANSVLAAATYTINLPPAATPVITPAGGAYTAPQTVTISDVTQGAMIYYTTDGTTPSANSRLYAGAMTVSANETIEAIAIASGYSNSAVAAAAYTIAKATPQITWPAPAAIPYGTALSTNQLNATASTGGTFSYAPASGAALGAGPHTLTVTFTPTDTTDYTTATATTTLTVNQAILTVTANNASRAYAAPNPTFTAVLTGFVNGDPQSVVSGSPLLTTPATAASPVSAYPITAAQGSLAASNYSFTFVNGTLTVNQAGGVIHWPAPAAINYGAALSGAQLDATATCSGASVTGTYVYSPASGVVLNSGSQILSVTFTPAGNSNCTFTSATVPLTINKDVLTITAANQSMTFGGVVPALTDAISGFVNNDSSSVVSGTATMATTGTSASAIGKYPITFSARGLAASNYTFNYVNGTLTINQASGVIHWTAPSAIHYGAALSGTQLDATATCSGASVNGTYVYSPASGAVLASGAQTLSVNFKPTSSNCTFTSATVPLTVNQVALTVTANSATRAYGTANPSFAVAFAGFVNGDTAATAVTGSPSFTTTATAKSPVSTYPITPAAGTLAAANYIFKFAAGTLTVTKASLTLTATSISVPYNQAIPKLTYSVAGYLNGDTSSALTGAPLEATTAAKGSGVGTYPISIAPGSLAASNYSFQFVNGTFTVTALGTTVTPVFHPAAGTSNVAVTVTVSDATAGAIEYFTTNGSTPTTTSAKFPSAGIKVTLTTTFTVIAVAPGYTPSAPASARYTIATAPTVTTTAATGISTLKATLNGTITANNAATQYWFAYGTSQTALTTTTPKTGSLTGTTATAISAKLTNLKTKTTYYFKAVASNGVGTVSGAVLKFTTN